jgi:hypothetical protein
MKELKLTHIAGIISATGIIGSAILYVGSLFFMTKDKAELVHAQIQTKIENVEIQTVDVQKAIIEQRTMLTYISRDIKDIKKKIK